MSLMPKETISVIGQSVGISKLSDDAAAVLAPDVEYRMREIVQEAIKFMLHSRRTTLTTDDVNSALRSRQAEPLYGYGLGSKEEPNPSFTPTRVNPNLFYTPVRELDLKKVVDSTTPKPPAEVGISSHWLAIDGIQPAIPENVPIQPLKAPDADTAPAAAPGRPEDLVDVKPAVKHVLSEELQRYFVKVAELVLSSASDSPMLNHALDSLATDAGLHALLPFFAQMVQDEVTRSLADYSLVYNLMRMVHSLLLNPHMDAGPYLHQLIPSVISCLVGKRLGGKDCHNHWDLRDYTASLVAVICHRYGATYPQVRVKINKTLVSSLLDSKRTIPQHYGALQGLAALGPAVVRLLVFPNLAVYLELLRPHLVPQQGNELKRQEALRMWGALQLAVGGCMYHSIKGRVQEGRPRAPGLPSSQRNVNTDPTHPGATIVRQRKRRSSAEVEIAAKRVRQQFELDEVDDEEMASPSTSLPLPAASAPAAAAGNHGSRGDSVLEGRSRASMAGEGREDLLASALRLNDEGKLWSALIATFGDGIIPFAPTPSLQMWL